VLAHAGAADESLGVILLVAGLWVGWIAVSRIRQRGFPGMPLAVAWAGVTLALVLVAASVVVPPRLFPRTPAGAAPPPTSGGPRPASTATLAIVRPADGATVADQDLEVVLRLDGGTIVNTTSTTLTPDTGHLHLSLDGAVVSMTFGVVQSVDLRSVAPGEHTLTAEFVAADHGPFNPRVTASVRFVKAASP
jgi:hypothetical protein